MNNAQQTHRAIELAVLVHLFTPEMSYKPIKKDYPSQQDKRIQKTSSQALKEKTERRGDIPSECHKQSAISQKKTEEVDPSSKAQETSEERTLRKINRNQFLNKCRDKKILRERLRREERDMKYAYIQYELAETDEEISQDTDTDDESNYSSFSDDTDYSSFSDDTDFDADATESESDESISADIQSFKSHLKQYDLSMSNLIKSAPADDTARDADATDSEYCKDSCTPWRTPESSDGEYDSEYSGSDYEHFYPEKPKSKHRKFDV